MYRLVLPDKRCIMLHIIFISEKIRLSSRKARLFVLPLLSCHLAKFSAFPTTRTFPYLLGNNARNVEITRSEDLKNRSASIAHKHCITVAHCLAGKIYAFSRERGSARRYPCISADLFRRIFCLQLLRTRVLRPNHSRRSRETRECRETLAPH